MPETQIVTALYAATLAYLAGNLAGAGWMRPRDVPPLPKRHRLVVRVAAVLGLALLAWASVTDSSPAIGRTECLAWLATLAESLAFLQIALQRDHGLYANRSAGEERHGHR